MNGHMNRESKAFKNLAYALETLFLALTGLYLLYRTSNSTTFHLVWPSHFEEYLMCAMAATAVARLFTCGLPGKKTLAALALALVYVLVYCNDGYRFLLFLAITTVGLADIDYRKILRVYLLFVGAFYAVTVLSGMMGLITNFVTARAGRGIRSAWGVSYYTDFASLGLFLLMGLWIARGRLPDWSMLVFCAGFMFLSACIAHSNTSTICAGLLMLAILYHGFERRVVEARRGLRWMKRGPELFATFGFPLLALCMFFMMLLYAKKLDVGYRLNDLLSTRLMHGVSAWKEYGLKPFGTPFEQRGNGFSTFPPNTYRFVDSTYALVLLRYGWVTFLALCLSWGYTALKARRCGDRRLLLIMGIIAVHAFSEHHFIESHFNILVTMPLAAYPPAEPETPVVRSDRVRTSTVAWTVTALLFALGAYAFGPMLLSRLKTALELMHYGHGSHALRLVCVMGVGVFFLCLSAWAVSAILKALLGRTGMPACRRGLAALLLCAVAGTGAWLYTGRVINSLGAECAPMVESDRRALEMAVRSAEGRVYAGVLPEVYVRAIDGLSYAAYFEDDLSRLRGATVLMPAESERGPFFDNGFLYVPISDAHALYTGDRAVVEALRGAGYRATGYYSSLRTVDLADAATLNGLAWEHERGVRLAGAQALKQCPWENLYGGDYTVTWTLALPEGVEQPRDGGICTLSVTTYKGERVIVERDVSAGEFDGEGRLTVFERFWINDSRNVAFEVRTRAGATVEVRDIRYLRTPDYDVHTFYDQKLRKARDEYYDADGRPVLCQEGWFACDYSYDRQGNVACTRYYDCDGKPTLTADGYAERRCDFNARRQLVREAYYGTDGTPILSAQGYAVREREYDDAGNNTVERYYDLEGRPVLSTKGYAEIRYEYDETGKVIREAYYGVDGAPVLSDGEYASVEYEYGADENEPTATRYLDEAGKLVRESVDDDGSA